MIFTYKPVEAGQRGWIDTHKDLIPGILYHFDQVIDDCGLGKAIPYIGIIKLLNLKAYGILDNNGNWSDYYTNYSRSYYRRIHVIHTEREV